MRKNWERHELLIALKIYCELEFGKFHHSTPIIVEVAEKIGRTSSALAMKLGNFASLDPAMNGKGLTKASKADKDLIDEYLENSEELIIEIEETWGKLKYKNNTHNMEENILSFEYDATEKNSVVKTRLVQSFFRNTVLCSYSYECAICTIDLKELLVASHIIPWSHNEKLRANPKNGILLCNLHDKAFDKGLITINSDFKIMLGTRIFDKQDNKMIKDAFLRYNNQMMSFPKRFKPEQEYLEYHRDKIYQG